MINSFQDERIAIESHFKNVWVDQTPIIYENTRQIPPKTGNWVRFQIVNSDKEQISIGTTQMHRNYAQVVVSIFVKKGQGTGEITDLADKAINAFTVLQIDSIQFRSGYKVPVGEIGDEWYQIDVIIPFYRNSLVYTS